MHRFLGLCIQILVVWVASTAFGLAAQAQGACTVPADLVTTRPNATGEPTPVRVSFYVLDIEAIDDAKQSVTIDFVMDLRWQDPRLGEISRNAGIPCRFALDAVWNPAVQIFNQRRVWARLPAQVQVTSDGEVAYGQRYYGTLASRLRLQAFPFDVQSLPINVVSFLETTDVVLVFDDKNTGRDEVFSVAGWKVGRGDAKVYDYRVVSAHKGDLKRYFSRLDYTYEASRDVSFYSWKVVLPLTLIVVMSWAVFYIEAGQIGPRLGVATTSILTLIAFLFSLRGILPPVSYLTRMDYFVYGSLGMVFAAYLEALTTSNLALKKKYALALRVDRGARVLWPACFTLVFVLFWR
jgi:hypothetical protein